jgi:nucleoside-diphosphate-sugar epimerase
MRIFLAGATGAVGRRLVPLLQHAHFAVIGTTRSAEKADHLRSIGVEASVIDMLDADAVTRAVQEARPDVVIHQLTDLPKVFDPAVMAEARVRNARLREEATPILMRAAQAAGVRRAIVQSICFAYAPGATPYVESDPINSPSVEAMERSALGTTDVEGIVLRYGRLWGPGTWTDVPKDTAPLHVDAAAHAAYLAIARGSAGIYNIAESDGTVSTAKAEKQLGFDSSFRLP